VSGRISSGTAAEYKNKNNKYYGVVAQNTAFIVRN
jgi:hypothetical protein